MRYRSSYRSFRGAVVRALPQFLGVVALVSIMVICGTARASTDTGKSQTPSVVHNTGSGSCASARTSGTNLQLVPAICVNPNALCRPGATGCGTIPTTAKVQLWVNATGQETYVQIVFVVETSIFDGVYMPGGEIPADVGTGGCDLSRYPCAESNGVPFFLNNIGRITSDITEKSVGSPSSSRVTFSMVDYIATDQGSSLNPTGTCAEGTPGNDDCDSPVYNVDVSTFMPAAQFATSVTNMLNKGALFSGQYNAPGTTSGWEMFDSDFADNYLDGSMITALYGAMSGSGLGWVQNATTDHVAILMGSTAPRDPNYLVNYDITDTMGGSLPWQKAGPSSGCEPAFTYASGNALPACETLKDIVNLAKADNVVIDVINLADGMTELGAGDYINTGYQATKDVTSVLSAGCYLATQTGGTWNGPTPVESGISFGCPAAETGSGGGNLTNTTIAPGSNTAPPIAWSSNPSLGGALISVRVPIINVAAYNTNRNTFQFIPTPGFTMGPGTVSFSCINNGTDISTLCAGAFNTTVGTGMGWGWPYSRMYLGDVWSATFQISVSASLPASELNVPIPVDYCLMASYATCASPSSAWYTDVIYTNYAFQNTNESFPPAPVVVTAENLVPPPPPPPGMPVLNPVGVSNPLGVNIPITNPLSQPLTMASPQPTLVGNMLSSPIAQAAVSPALVGVFSLLGVAQKITQRRKVAMRMASKKGE